MEFKEKAVEFSQETTMHGVQYIGKSNIHWARRVLWALTVHAMLGIAMWQIVDKFVHYYQRPSETKTTIRNENMLDFPAITICNMNKLRKSMLGPDAVGYAIIMKSLFNPNTLSEAERYLIENEPDFRIEEPNDEYIENFYRNSHQLEDMIMNISWKEFPVNRSEYFSRIVTDEGICFTFHSEDVQKTVGHRLNTTTTGSLGGIWLRMDVEQTKEYFFGPENSAGFKILIHDPQKFPLVAELGFAVGPGTETFVSVKKNEVISLPPPYDGSICRDTHKSDFVNPLEYFPVYNQPACRLECQTKYVLTRCGCRIYYQPGLDTDMYCSAYKLYTCAMPALGNYTKSTTALKECDCFQECRTTSYEVSVSNALYPAKHILEDIHRATNLSDEFIVKNFLEVRIFFEEMNVAITEQKPAYLAGDLLADVGGTAGLFLGASLLTVMEMGEFLLISALSFCKHLTVAGKVKQNSKENGKPTDNNKIREQTKEDAEGIYGTIFSMSKGNDSMAYTQDTS